MNPVKVVINFIAQTLKEVLEKRSKVSVVRFVFELQCSAVSAILGELFREAFAEIIDFSHNLFFLDFLILFFDVPGLEVLPGETASQEVHKEVTEGLDIISSTLFNTKMSAHRSITSSTSQTLPFSVFDVIPRRTHKLFSQTKINDVNTMSILLDADSEVVRLYISVDDSSGVNVLNSFDHLVSCHQHSLYGKLPTTLIKQIFERKTK